MTSSSGQWIVRNHWSPGSETLGGAAVCRLGRCRYHGSFQASEAKCGAQVGIESVPDFRAPRLIIWHQRECVACRTSEPVFRAVQEAARARGFTVHLVEATGELIARFPHVTVVPLYDLVTPDAAPGACSPYGTGTALRSLRNDLGALRAEFPSLTLPPPLPPAGPTR